MTLGLRSIVILLLILFSSFVKVASAQTKIILSGRVIDPDGAAVVGAPVTATPLPTGTRVATRTGDDGTFNVPNLAAGRYQLEINAPGFSAWTQDVTLGTEALNVDATLQIATLSEDVIVRANAIASSIGKTAAPLRDQPLTVNRVTSEYLVSQGINDLVVALQSVANVNSWNQYGVYEYYSFRGFSDSVQMVDGIRNEGNRVRTQLSNVESVEILKGPASVLYGSEAVGGTVNIVLKKPSLQPAYEGALSVGSWETVRTYFGATGRLGSDRLLYRFDFGSDMAENFRHDPWNKVNATPSLSWRIGDHDLFDFRYSFNRNDLSGDAGIPQVTNPDGSIFIPDVPRGRRYNTLDDFALSYDQNIRSSYTHTFRNGFGIRNNFSGRLFDDEYWVAETLSVTYPSTVNRTFLYFKHKRRPWTNQVELTGQFDAGVRHDLLVGWDFQDYSSRTTRAAEASVSTTPIDLYNPVETSTFHPTFDPTRYDYTDALTNGLYVQDQLTISNQLKAVLGVRRDEVNRDNHNNPVTNGVETEVPPTERRSLETTGRAGIVYQPTAQIDLFSQYANFWRPNFNIQPDGTPLEPELGYQVEVGQRLRAFNDRLQLSAAAFHILKRNVQNARPGGFFDQAGKVRSRGFELDADARLSSNVRITTGYGFTATEYLDYRTPTADFSGNERPRVPRHTLSVLATFRPTERLTVTANTEVKGDQVLNDANTLELDAYALLDLGASYSFHRMQLLFNVTNVTDEHYYRSTLGSTQFYPGEPRRFLFTVRFR